MGEVEEGEALEAGAAQFAVDHQVRRRRHQGQHAADEAGKGQRHQQAPRRDLHAVGDTQHHGNEDGHHTGGAHHRAEPGDRQHQQHQQARFAAARGAHQPVAQAVGDAGAYQAVADDEQCGDQHHARIAEAGQCLLHAEHTRSGAGRPWPAARPRPCAAVQHEQTDAAGQQGEDQKQIAVHGNQG